MIYAKAVKEFNLQISHVLVVALVEALPLLIDGVLVFDVNVDDYNNDRHNHHDRDHNDGYR